MRDDALTGEDVFTGDDVMGPFHMCIAGVSLVRTTVHTTAGYTLPDTHCPLLAAVVVTIVPDSIAFFASSPRGVLAATAARSMSPVARWHRQFSFLINGLCVPLPLPGGPVF